MFRDHRYWMTFVNALHGNRREEPVVLKVKHVKRTASGIWYFNWAAPELADLLKDIGSPRDVPLHETLISMGFLEARVYGRDPEAPLFPEAHSHSVMARHAQPYGSWFGLFCDDCGVRDPALDTHAWRHTVVTNLGLAGVSASLIEEIVGHESENRRSELGTYTHAASLELLKEAIDKLHVPINVAALRAAVARSDLIDRSAAWPDLSNPDIVPKRKSTKPK